MIFIALYLLLTGSLCLPAASSSSASSRIVTAPVHGIEFNPSFPTNFFDVTYQLEIKDLHKPYTRLRTIKKSTKTLNIMDEHISFWMNICLLPENKAITYCEKKSVLPPSEGKFKKLHKCALYQDLCNRGLTRIASIYFERGNMQQACTYISYILDAQQIWHNKVSKENLYPHVIAMMHDGLTNLRHPAFKEIFPIENLNTWKSFFAMHADDAGKAIAEHSKFTPFDQSADHETRKWLYGYYHHQPLATAPFLRSEVLSILQGEVPELVPAYMQSQLDTLEDSNEKGELAYQYLQQAPITHTHTQGFAYLTQAIQCHHQSAITYAIDHFKTLLNIDEAQTLNFLPHLAQSPHISKHMHDELNIIMAMLLKKDPTKLEACRTHFEAAAKSSHKTLAAVARMELIAFKPIQEQDQLLEDFLKKLSRSKSNPSADTYDILSHGLTFQAHREFNKLQHTPADANIIKKINSKIDRIHQGKNVRFKHQASLLKITCQLHRLIPLLKSKKLLSPSLNANIVKTQQQLHDLVNSLSTTTSGPYSNFADIIDQAHIRELQTFINFKLAILYLFQNKTNECITYARKTLECDNSKAQLTNIKNLFQEALKNGNLEVAREALNLCLTTYPNEYISYKLKAQLAAKRDNMHEVIESYIEAGYKGHEKGWEKAGRACIVIENYRNSIHMFNIIADTNYTAAFHLGVMALTGAHKEFSLEKARAHLLRAHELLATIKSQAKRERYRYMCEYYLQLVNIQLESEQESAQIHTYGPEERNQAHQRFNEHRNTLIQLSKNSYMQQGNTYVALVRLCHNRSQWPSNSPLETKTYTQMANLYIDQAIREQQSSLPLMYELIKLIEPDPTNKLIPYAKMNPEMQSVFSLLFRTTTSCLSKQQYINNKKNYFALKIEDLHNAIKTIVEIPCDASDAASSSSCVKKPEIASS